MASHRRNGPLQVSLAVAGIVVCIYFAYACLFMGSDLPAPSEGGVTHLQVQSVQDGGNASQQQQQQQDEAPAQAGSKLSEQDIRARGKAAVLGAFVADAATMPLHW